MKKLVPLLAAMLLCSLSYAADPNPGAPVNCPQPKVATPGVNNNNTGIPPENNPPPPSEHDGLDNNGNTQPIGSDGGGGNGPPN